MPRQKSTHVDNPLAVGQRLRVARERAGLSQRALAFPGCSPAYISRIEAGERIPSLQLLRELGRRLGVSEDYLATGSEGGDMPLSIFVDAELALRMDDVEQARGLYEQALAEARDQSERAEAFTGLGYIDLREGRAREAIARFEQALALAGLEPADRPSLAESLGRAYALVGELAPAIAIFERCVDRYERAGDPVCYVRFACLLGYALTDNGDFSRAEQVVAKALGAGREITDPYTRARLYWSQSRLLGEQGQSDASAHYAQMALETLRVTEDAYALAHAYQLLAHAYLDAGRAEEATALLREARPLIEASATSTDLAHYEIEEARALAALGEGEQAAAVAMRVTAALGDARPGDTGRAYILLGEIFGRLDQPARALEVCELGIEILESQPPSRYLVDAYRQLASLLEAEGRATEALEALKSALAVQDRVGRPVT